MSVTLWQGDCLELMKNIPDGSVDMVLTDPPYGTTACKWDSVIPFDPMWERLKRIVKRGGAIVLFGSEPFSSLLRASNIDWYKYDWIWEKEQSSSGLQAKIAPMKKHENISVFYQTFSDCYDTTEMFADSKNICRQSEKRRGLVERKQGNCLGLIWAATILQMALNSVFRLKRHIINCNQQVFSICRLKC